VTGLSLISIELLAAGLSGGGVNPARVLAAAVVRPKFEHYEWIYFVGYSPDRSDFTIALS
jgi:glycerol uptake facilitator-like aquaporin